MNKNIPHSLKSLRLLSFTTAAVMVLPCLATAQVQPDSGQMLQQLQEAPVLPESSKGLVIETPARAQTTPGGPEITLQSIVLNGNSVFPDDVLQKIVGNALGKTYDLAGLKAIADRITAFYHDNDYPFARAFVPSQNMADGALQIEIVEGRYGEIKAVGEDPRLSSAQKFLQLPSGAVIKGHALERSTLILDDQPGYKITPIIRPGQDVGTGDLLVRTEREKRFGGEASIDNHGNRYTGRIRGGLDLYANSPFLFGDQVKINTIYTEEDLWYGSVNYNLPIGYSGLRGSLGYSHTYYELGKEFSNLDAHGTAKVASVGLTYPLIRSQGGNLSLSGTYQHKWLMDEQDTTNTSNSKSSDTFPLTLGFDMRDKLLDGGISYGALTWTHGALDLDHGLKLFDAVSAKSDGTFDKVNLDLARLQGITPSLSLFARVSAQWAADNLDSSESFGLGGPNGVRAYPAGEGYGDEGALAQVEVRYRIHDFTPYAFYDAGHIKFNNNPWAAGDNDRTVAGAGLGLRFEKNGWHADASAAWRTQGGDPQSDSKDDVPVVWLRAGYRF